MKERTTNTLVFIEFYIQYIGIHIQKYIINVMNKKNFFNVMKLLFLVK